MSCSERVPQLLSLPSQLIGGSDSVLAACDRLTGSVNPVEAVHAALWAAFLLSNRGAQANTLRAG